jgi:hypothetical protein
MVEAHGVMRSLNFFSKNYLSFALIALVVLVSNCLMCLSLRADAQVPVYKQSLHITVFVHGSVYTALSMLDARHVLADRLSEYSPYVGLVKNVRKNPLIWQDQVMMEEGWHPVSGQAIISFIAGKLPQDMRQYAAYQAIPVYEMMSNHCNKDTQDRIYFLFGHLGLLSQNYRSNIAYDFYKYICDTIDKYRPDYEQIWVDIVAHSHGGNIAFNLVKAEEKYKRGLVIDNLVLWGTPLQIETTAFAYNQLFKRVINCYSDGDKVQGNDRFSTFERRSYKQFSHGRLVGHKSPNKLTKVYDVRFLVNQNARCLGHVNMWIMGRAEKIINNLDPLPAFVLTPLLLDLLDSITLPQQMHHFDCNIIDSNQRMSLVLFEHKQQHILATSDNIYHLARQVCGLVDKNWAPDDKSRKLIFNYQAITALWHAIQEWRMGP